MKNTKKFASIATAALLAACTVVPSMASLPMNVSAASLSITGIDENVVHTFEVYQVFTGDLSDGVLSNVKWGSGVAQYNGTDVTDSTLTTTDGYVTDTVLDELTNAEDGTESERARAFIKKLTFSSTKACDDVTSSNGTASITGLSDGYYVVKDVTDLSTKDDANSAWILQVAGDMTNLEIKNASPTVDKQVYDNNDGTGNTADGSTGEGWYESADHAINETFQFKLTATIPADTDLSAYDEYKLVFHDTMSSGVTFDGINSVTVKAGESSKTLDTSDYASTAEENTAGADWTLTIEDVTDHMPEGTTLGTDVTTVEVIYNAHLNADAVVSNVDVSNEGSDALNNNKVYLEYSNNPDSTGTGETGKTPDDYVWVFTYKVENTKYANEAKPENVLAGAQFKLYTDSTCENEVGLIFDASKNAYRPIVSGSETATAMTSADSTGKFDIIGLDAGTYYLKEILTPQGYNTMDVKTITIGASHTEDEGDATASLTLSGDSTMSNALINKSGSTLPSTGGIGTTIFYIGGGVLVVGAGVLLITKKRAKSAEEA